MWTRDKIAATIDHAVLSPLATANDVAAACKIGCQYKVASVCVRPCDVLFARALLAGTGVKVSTVIGFPHGGATPAVKVFEANQAVDQGAEELDMVINLGMVDHWQWGGIENEIRSVVDAVSGVPVKVIVESCYLSKHQLRMACIVATNAGAAYVKTSTGFGTGGATYEDINVMIEEARSQIKIKASGGIHTLEQATAFLDLGCSRLGTSSTKAILEEAPQ